MKIAFVIHDINPYGGQERSTLEIVNHLAEHHDVHVFSSSFSGLNSKIKTHKVPVGLRRPVWIKDFIFRICATFMIWRKGFDLIHITGTCSFIADIITVQFCHQRWAIERRRLPKTFSFRQVIQEFQTWTDLFWEWLIFALLRNKQYIALSETVAGDLKKYYSIKKIAVIPHGVNFDEFKPLERDRLEIRKEQNVKDDELVILFVGTFERKGLFYLIPALKQLGKPFRLFVVGSGPRLDAETHLFAAGLLEKAVFFGHRKDVERFYRAADIFVLPSLYDPFGLVGIEALATGLPSIVSRASGVSQHIKPGVNGYVLEHADSVDLLAELLNKIAEDVLKTEMGPQTRESVIDAKWTNIFPKYDELFKASRSGKKQVS
jgi:UDP-glucose:(heptosyl)LPS alpha-1,3-glucosyltransferase